MTPFHPAAAILLVLGLLPMEIAWAQQPALGASCELGIVSPNRWDYRRERWTAANRARFEWQLKDLEDNHFRPYTELLVRPTTGRTIGSDLRYVLNLWPNHHRALVTLVRLGEREQTNWPKNTSYTIACYFERALDYAKDDTVVRGLYADYLAKRSEKSAALYQLDLLKKFAGQSPLAHHNAGLIYFGLGEFDRALEQAHRAEELGMPEKSLLRRQLETAGKWGRRQAVDEAASAASAASAAGSPGPEAGQPAARP
jgi:tetratricopeptide (TPR) repeat protein